MSGILAPINDIITKLSSLDVSGIEGLTGSLYTGVWNGQMEQFALNANNIYSFPAAFVEVVIPDKYNQLAGGVTESDVTFRIHVLDQDTDSGDGPVLSVFALRDAIIKLLTYYQPTGCSNLQKVAEQQDYDHSNLYHYIIDFKCSFIDDRGDQRQGLTPTVPPTALNIVASLGPLEILSLSYVSPNLLVDYRLFYTQDVQFAISGGPVFDAGTLTHGTGQYQSPALSLPPGFYSVTGKAVASNYTTGSSSFQIT